MKLIQKKIRYYYRSSLECKLSSNVPLELLSISVSFITLFDSSLRFATDSKVELSCFLFDVDLILLRLLILFINVSLLINSVIVSISINVH